MHEANVVAAFCNRRQESAAGIKSDGAKLFSEGSMIAFWDGRTLRILPAQNKPLAERHKNMLVEHLLFQLHRDGVVARMVHTGAKMGMFHRTARSHLQAGMK